jgi:nucleotide-binding universal stress UspA family protein
LTPERRGVFGGVADEVLRTAASPVLVVKAAVD